MGSKLQTGDIINQQFEIMEKIGEGGMSLVYRAKDLNQEKEVAIKLLKEKISSNYIEDLVRFKREAETVSKLNHSYVVKIYNAGEYENIPYIVEEKVPGKNLSLLFEENESFNQKDSITIIKQLTQALSYVHNNGIVHRDIKPGNISIYRDKKNIHIKLLDFGIAHVIELSKIKKEKEVVGTFGYMSPEATGIVNKPIDERSDLYSLGIVFYRLLCGELPFKAKQVNKLLHEQVAMKPGKLRVIKPEIPKILEEIVIKLLNKEPELRYQSAKGLLNDLEKLEDGNYNFIIGQQDQKVKLTYQSRFVGREEEIEKIRKLFNKAKESNGNICLIGGEPGVGKTRLVDAIREHSYEQGYKDGGMFIRGRCMNQKSKNPYQPFKDALNEYIRKLEKTNKEEKEREIKRLKNILGDLGEIIIQLNPNMKQLLGEVPKLIKLDPERENQRFLMVASTFFCNLTAAGLPCLLFLDDLQWADEGSLILLEEIADKVNESTLLILGTYRNDEVDEHHSLYHLIKNSEQKKWAVLNIQLTKFNLERLNRLVAGVLGEKIEDAKNLSEYILEKSEGNAFFSITILRELVEEKALLWKNGSWHEDWDKIKKVRISENIIDMIIKRIKDLNEKQIRTLCLGSIIGREFNIALLYELLDYEKEEIINLIDELKHKQLIEESIKKGNLLFVHDRVREAFQKKISSSDKKQFHLKIAKALESLNIDTIDEVIFELAYHFTEAEDKKKSLEYVIPASEKAKAGYANLEAIKYCKISINLLEENGLKNNDTWIKIKESLTELYLRIGQSDEAINVAYEILLLKENNLEKAKIYRKIGNAYFKKGDFKLCEINFKKGLFLLKEKLPMTKLLVFLFVIKELFIHSLHFIFPYHPFKKKNPDRENEIIWFYNTLAWSYVLVDINKFLNSVLRALNIAESKIGKSRELGSAMGGYSCGLMGASLFKKAIKNHNKALMIRKDAGDEWGIAQSLGWLGYCYSWSANHKEARDIFCKAIEKFEKIGDIWELSMSYHGLAHAYRYTGSYEKGIKYDSKHLEQSRKIKNNYGIVEGAACISYCYTEKGEFEKADKFGKEAVDISVKHKNLFAMCFSKEHYGYLKLESGFYEEAIQYFEEAKILYESNLFIKDYTIYIYPYLADAYIEFEINKKSKIEKSALKKIKKACKKSLRQTFLWKNHHGASLRVAAKYYKLKGSFKKSNKYFLKSIAQTKKLSRKFEQAKGHYEYAEFFNYINKSEKAKEQYHKAYDIFKEIGAKKYIKSISDIIGLKDEREETDTRITSQERLKTELSMNTVLGTSRYLSSILDLDELLDKIMESTIQLTGAERGALYLYSDNNKKKHLELKVLRDVTNTEEKDTFSVSKSILERVEKEKKPLIISDAATEESLKLRASIIQKNIKSIICSPIMTKGELLGIIYLDSHLVSGLFSDNDLQVLELLAGQSGVSIQNARLYKDALVKERMEQDMKVGAQIQQFFLPDKITGIKNFEIDASYSPAEFIGGDYYDLVKINENKYAIIIVDISGHGSSAAIVMSVVSFIFHLLIEKIHDPGELMRQLSNRFYKRLKMQKFATGIIIIYDKEKDHFEYVNAGHSDIIRYSKEKNIVENINGNISIPIGIKEKSFYKTSKFNIDKGDLIVLQTDGIFETRNDKKEMFSLERVKKIILDNCDKAPKMINTQIIKATENFRKDEMQDDDVTIITLKKL